MEVSSSVNIKVSSRKIFGLAVQILSFILPRTAST